MEYDGSAAGTCRGPGPHRNIAFQQADGHLPVDHRAAPARLRGRLSDGQHPLREAEVGPRGAVAVRRGVQFTIVTRWLEHASALIAARHSACSRRLFACERNSWGGIIARRAKTAYCTR